MPDIKISGLPAASSVAGTDEFEANQSGTSRKVTAAQIRDAVLPSLSGNAGKVLAVNSGATGTEWVPFTATPEVETPTNVSPANAATDVGETPTLTGSTYRSLYGKTQKSSQWQISTVSNFASTVYDSGEVVAVGVTRTVPASTISTNTTYYWRVRYRDESDVWSAWSAGTSFTTAAVFNNFIAAPDAVPSIGASHQGGYYFGQIWDEITTSSTSTTIGTGSKTFTVSNSAPLFYSGQAVKVVSRGAAGSRVMEGTVSVSGGTTLVVNVTSVTGSGTYTDWSVLVKYRLIISPKASGETSGVAYKNSTTSAPAATRNLTNGAAATAAMVAADTSAVYPLAHWADNLSINGYTDWYIPARDEFELIYRNLKPEASSNSTDGRAKSSITYNAGGNQDDGSDGVGVNRHSVPPGAAYTASVPAQTSIAAFQIYAAEALGAGGGGLTSTAYMTATEYSAANYWYQTNNNAQAGNQTSFYKYDGARARAIRRSLV